MSHRVRHAHPIAINAYWVGVSFMWNALHPIVLPVLLLSFASESTKNTSYGLLTFFGMIVALLVQPISGALSDRTRHHLGRRRPWIIAGTLLDLVFLSALVLAPNYWTMALSYVLLQFSSNLAHGPGQGLIPDLMPADRRGVASGAKSALEMAGTIAAALTAGRLMSGTVLHPGIMLAAMAGLLLAGMAVTCLGAPETPLPEARASARIWRQRSVPRVVVMCVAALGCGPHALRRDFVHVCHAARPHGGEGRPGQQLHEQHQPRVAQQRIACEHQATGYHGKDKEAAGAKAAHQRPRPEKGRQLGQAGHSGRQPHQQLGAAEVAEVHIQEIKARRTPHALEHHGQ